MSNPILSVIMPVYNEESDIGEALDSILEQTLSDIEIICVDDGSTDSTADIIRERARADSRIRLLEQQNSGPGPARNWAIKESRGSYIAFMDGDDYLPDRDTYKTLVDTARKFDVEACCGHVLHDYNGELTSNDPLRHYAHPQLLRYRDYQFDYGFVKYVYRSDLIKRNDIAFPALRRFQDPPFLVRCLSHAQCFAYAAIPSYVIKKTQGEEPSWTFEKARDYAKGILDLVMYSREHGLAKLHYTQLVHINHNWYDSLMTHARNDSTGEIVALLHRINEGFDPFLLGLLKPDIDESFCIRALNEL